GNRRSRLHELPPAYPVTIAPVPPARQAATNRHKPPRSPPPQSITSTARGRAHRAARNDLAARAASAAWPIRRSILPAACFNQESDPPWRTAEPLCLNQIAARLPRAPPAISSGRSTAANAATANCAAKSEFAVAHSTAAAVRTARRADRQARAAPARRA